MQGKGLITIVAIVLGLICFKRAITNMVRQQN